MKKMSKKSKVVKPEVCMNSPLMLPAPSWYRLKMYEFEKYRSIKELGLLKKVDLLELSPDGEFRKVGEKELAGIQAMLPEAFVVRVWEDIESKGLMIDAQRRVEELVQAELPDHKVMPSHPGWIGRTKAGDGSYFEVLVSSAERDEKPNKANSRLTRLTGHLDWRSRYIGTARVRVLRTDLFSDYDGWCLVRPGFVNMPWDCVKVYGTVNMGPGYVKGGAPTVKCVAESNMTMWKRACRELKIKAESVDIIIPEISLKFDDGSDRFDVELFSVFDNVLGEHMTVTLQMLMNLPLTDEASAWAASKMIKRMNIVRDALADVTGMSVARLLASDSDSLCQFLEDDYSDSDVEEARETMTATLSKIVTGMPFETSKYLKAVLPDVMRMLKRFTINGVSDTVLPDSGLNSGEITISKRAWKSFRRMGIEIKVGDNLLVVRHPVTGTECCLCTVVSIGRTAINPQWWASRFAGDFDGDRIAFGYLGNQGITTFVDESRIEYLEPVAVGKANLDIYEANAAGWYSQAMVPTADRYLRIARELGKPTMALRRLLQDVIDSSKHSCIVDFPSALKASGMRPEIQPSCLVRIMSGSLGSKAFSLMNYNRYVHESRFETTKIGWMNIVRKSGALFNVFSGTGDSDYATRYSDVVKFDITKGYVFEMVKGYRASLKAAGIEGLMEVQANHEPMACIPKEILNSARGQALLGRASEINIVSRMMAADAVKLYQKFISNISSGVVSTGEAYQPVRDAVMMLKESQHGPGAMKWMFLALNYGCDSAIRMKALSVLSYMPLKLGEYNIEKILDFLGYDREFAVIIK